MKGKARLIMIICIVLVSVLTVSWFGHSLYHYLKAKNDNKNIMKKLEETRLEINNLKAETSSNIFQIDKIKEENSDKVGQYLKWEERIKKIEEKLAPLE